MQKVKNVIAGKQAQSVTIRFPQGLVPAIDNAAKKEGRSRNTEVIVRLLSTFDPPDQKTGNSAA